jgi:hypothetical protein
MKLKSFGVVPEKGDEIVVSAFKNLKERLRNYPFLLYYRPTISLEGKRFAPDILLLHPQIGIGLINVRWWDKNFLSRVFWNNNGKMVVDGEAFPNPLDEEGETIRELVALFKGKYNINYFLYLPNLTKSEYENLYTFRSKVGEERIFFKYDKELKDKLLRGSGLTTIPLATPKEFDEIREKIFPYLQLRTGGVLDLHQEEFVHNIGSGIRILRGAAGTGKTAVLSAKAQYESTIRNRRVVVFTFIKPLLQDFRRRLDDGVECQLIDTFIKNHYPQYNFANLAIAVEKIEIPEEEKYDVVICDEVQDFKQPYFKLLKKLIKKEGLLLFGVDETQRIYPWSDWNWKEVGINAKGRVTILRKSYRNPSRIVEIGVKFLQQDPVLIRELKELDALDVGEVGFHREGGKLICVSDALLGQFVKHYKPEETFILVPTPVELERYGKILQEAKVKTTIFRGEMDLDQIQPGHYILTTFRSAKGMERKNVVVVINDEVMEKHILTKKDERLWRKAIYVAITRAKENILIVGSGKFYNELVNIKMEMEERELLIEKRKKKKG